MSDLKDHLFANANVLQTSLAFKSLELLHEHALLHSRYATCPSRISRNTEIDIFDYAELKKFELFPVNNWFSFCEAAGMTVYGAVALSWCEGAELSQVWEGWEASGFPLKPLPEFERPARFINPALLPATNSLKDIITIAENKPLPICAMMVAKRDSLEIDLPDSMLKSATPQIASFLKAHMERKDGRTTEENALIKGWDETITGTEWEV